MELTVIIVLLVIGFFINYADKVRDGNATNKANQIFYDRMYDMLEELKESKQELKDMRDSLRDINNSLNSVNIVPSIDDEEDED